jgi:hypothetical protein
MPVKLSGPPLFDKDERVLIYQKLQSRRFSVGGSPKKDESPIRLPLCNVSNLATTAKKVVRIETGETHLEFELGNAEDARTLADQVNEDYVEHLSINALKEELKAR